MENNVILYQPTIFDEYKAEIKTAITSSKNGFSTNNYESCNLALHVKDDKELVLKNRKLISSFFNERQVLFAKQTHSNIAIEVDNHTEFLDNIEADALITNQKNVCIGILTADCVPLLLYDPINEICGAIHAGWKGLTNDIIKNTIDKFIEKGSNPQNIIIHIGPCIEFQNYEIDKSILENFCQTLLHNCIHDHPNNSKCYLDLKKYTYNYLTDHNINNEKIQISSHCTFDSKDLFSARRLGIESGRFGSCIMML